MKHATKLFLIVFFLVLTSSYSFGQSWIWAKGGINRDTASWSGGWAVAVDSSNNVFETGIFDGGTFFGANLLTTVRPSGVGDFFLAKYDSNGNVLWADSANAIGKLGGNGAYNIGFSVCADKLGFSYATGRYRDTIIFGTDTLKSLDKTTNFFLTKFDPNGNVVWAKDAHLLTSSDIATGYAVTTDRKNNILVAGAAANNVAFGPDTVINGSFFLAKYDLNGNVRWLKQSTTSGLGSAVITDDLNNVYAAGQYTFGITLGAYHFLTSGTYGVFLAKYDSSGNLKWAKSPQTWGGGTNKPNSIITDNVGNVYMTGTFGDSIIFGSIKLKAQYKNIYNENMFIAKYSPSGGVIWAMCGGTPAGSWASGISVTVDKHGHLYVSGGFLDTIQFGPILLKASTSSAYIMEFDTACNPLFGTVVNTSNGPGNAMSLSPQGASLYFGGVVGYGYTYYRQCIFGTDTLKSPGVQFAYLAKWGLPPDSLLLGSSKTYLPKEAILLFPNPNNGAFTIQSSVVSGQSSVVEIYNMLGEKVYSKQLSTLSSQLSINASAGIYLYRVITETGTVVGSGKFVVE